jgi:hypothetical protein
MPKVKTAGWGFPDAEARKRGEQTGLDTLVVHALNNVCWITATLTSSES